MKLKVISLITLTAAVLVTNLVQAKSTESMPSSSSSGTRTLVGLVTYPKRNIHKVFAKGAVNGIRGQKVQDNTPFRIASITKTFTAAAILKLIEQNRFGLDSPINDLLSKQTVALMTSASANPSEITVRHLLGHRSGLFDYATTETYINAVLTNPVKKWSRTEQLAIALNNRPSEQAGNTYRYADTNYILLGEIIEQSTGQTLAENYRKLLNFDGLGLKQTYLESAEPTPSEQPARLHSYVQGIDTYNIDPSFDLFGGGGLVSTAKELSQFYRALFAGRVVNETSLKEMTQAVSGGGFGETAYGLGLMPFYIGNNICYGHEGFANVVAGHCPSLDYTFVFAAGSDQTPNIGLLNQGIGYRMASNIGIEVAPKPYRNDFERTRCPPELLTANAKTLCGMLHVPEDRREGSKRKIRFPVLIAKNLSKPAQIEPLLLLGGGPGDALFPTLPALFSDPDGSAALLDGQDIVAVEYRGVGAAIPRLQCDNRLTNKATVAKCLNKFDALGVNLSHYNSKEYATDLEQLRRSLRVPRWNILGFSFGTRAAITVLRDRPSTVKSLVLDGVAPPEEDLNNADSYAKTIDAIFASCQASVGCNSAFPNLKTRLYKTLNQLNHTPLILQGLAINGDSLAQSLVAFQGSPKILAYLPAVLNAYANVDTAFIGSTLAGNASVSSDGLLPPDPTFSDGVFFSTLCNEQAPFVNRARLKAQINGNDPIRRSVAKNVLTNLNICKQWPSGRGISNESQAVPLSVPTVVFNGEFDLQTPAIVGRGVAVRSPLAKGFDFPAIGHIALQQSPACAITILADFQRNQNVHAVDASCLALLPKAEWKTVIDDEFYKLLNGG